MIKILGFCSLFMGCSFYAQQSGNEAAPQPPPADKVAVTFVNNNNHKIEVSNKRDICDCTPYFGPEFKRCMTYVSAACYKKNLASINDRGRARYAADLTLGEIKELKESFTESEWQELRHEQAEFIKSIEGRWDAARLALEQLEKNKGLNRAELCFFVVLGIIGLSI